MPMGTLRQRAGMVMLASLALALTACGGGSSPGPHPPSSSASTVRPGPSATPTPLPASLAWEKNYPAQDTPLDSAPLALVKVWAPTGVSIIPGLEIFKNIPQPATLNNYDSALSASAFHTEVAEVLREAALQQWAEAKDQSNFLTYLEAQSQVPGQMLLDMAAHMPIVDPNCDVYPTSLSVFPTSPALLSFMQANNSSVSSRDNVVLSEGYTPPAGQSCNVYAVSPSGNKSIGSFSSPGITLSTGYVLTSVAVGPFYYIDAQGDCGTAGAPQAMCAGS